MNANSIVLMLQDKLPKNFALLKMLEDKLASLDEKKLNELAQKLPSLNLKSPAIVFWVGSLIFGAFGVNRFMTGQIWLGVLKLALFLAHIIFIIIIAIWMTGMPFPSGFDDGFDIIKFRLPPQNFSCFFR